MDFFSLEWTPMQGPNGLTPFEAFQEVERDEETPDHESRWAKVDLRGLLVGSPGCEDVVWKSVLAIWRLKSMEERLKEETALAEPWAQHLSAWLTRHRELCLAFHLTPFKIIAEYANTCVKRRHLPEDMAFQVDSPKGTPETANTASAEGSATPQPPQASTKDVSKPHTDTRSFCPMGMNLSSMKMTEGDRLDTKVVPQAEGLVCGACSAKKSPQTTCIPIWCKGKEGTIVMCEPCRNRRQGCSFRPMHFGIRVFPEVKKKNEKIKVDIKDSGPSVVREMLDLRDLSTSASRTSTTQTAKAAQKTPASGTVPILTPIKPSVGAPNLTTSTTLFYEDLTPFALKPGGPKLTLLDLQLRRAAVRAILRREFNDAAELVATGMDREEVGTEIIKAFDKAIVRRRSPSVMDLHSSDQDWKTDSSLEVGKQERKTKSFAEGHWGQGVTYPAITL
ncbi:hypothetical protein BJ322DRAFT_1114155 [Thelephora terrestris]|uniref:Uncharacterized protein n=1 Tax=Thelephora terrestris TaxID=56493 RepID=A0A9P6H3W0_9AGAM|nr:hypothetical protein BJ322DRAFT_1114155 [Thelephora terrestris]